MAIGRPRSEQRGAQQAGCGPVTGSSAEQATRNQGQAVEGGEEDPAVRTRGQRPGRSMRVEEGARAPSGSPSARITPSVLGFD